jgi:hypothetical protein
VAICSDWTVSARGVSQCLLRQPVLRCSTGAVGGVEPEPLGDPGRGATLRTPGAVGHGNALLSLILVALGGTLKATSLPARMRGAGVGKQCRKAPDRRATHHPAAVDTGRRSGRLDRRLLSARELEPRTVALKRAMRPASGPAAQRGKQRVGCRNPFMQLVGDTHGAGHPGGRGGAQGAGSR